MAWTYGANTLSPGESQRWWLAWGGYPGLEVIGVAPSEPGSEITYTTPGTQTNGDGSTTYFVTVRKYVVEPSALGSMPGAV